MVGYGLELLWRIPLSIQRIQEEGFVWVVLSQQQRRVPWWW